VPGVPVKEPVCPRLVLNIKNVNYFGVLKGKFDVKKSGDKYSI
jgi:hypothetical protein